MFISNATRAEVITYLDDCVERGFNSLIVTSPDKVFADNAPANAYGDAPFTTPGDFSTPNEAYFEHADCLQQAALRVPLIVRYPPTFPQGKRVASQASSIDVAPTILASLGLPIPAAHSGRPLQHLEPEDDRYVLVQHPLYDSKTAADRVQPRRLRCLQL